MRDYFPTPPVFYRDDQNPGEIVVSGPILAKFSRISSFNHSSEAPPPSGGAEEVVSTGKFSIGSVASPRSNLEIPNK